MEPPGKPTPWSIALAIAGAVAGLLGLLVACISLAVLSDPQVTDAESTRLSWMACFFCLALPSLLTGFITLWVAWLQRGRERERILQRQIVGMARAREDRLTAADVALHSPLSQNEAEQVLERLAGQEICYSERLEDGSVQFIFPRDRSEQSGLDRVSRHE